MGSVHSAGEENDVNVKHAFLELCLAALDAIKASRDSRETFHLGMASGYVGSADVLRRNKSVRLTPQELDRFASIRRSVEQALSKSDLASS